MRHPRDRGTALHRWVISVLQLCNDRRAWRRHPAPFNKTRRGGQRRAERKFKLASQLLEAKP